jgi:hypothetical protein
MKAVSATAQAEKAFANFRWFFGALRCTMAVIARA